MDKYLKSRNNSTKASLEALSWNHPGKTCVHINSGQWLSPKSRYWDYPEKSFEAQMRKIERNEAAGCGNFPFLLVDYGDTIIPTMFGARLGDIDGGPWIEHVLNDISDVKNMPKPALDNPMWLHFLRTLDYFMDHILKTGCSSPLKRLLKNSVGQKRSVFHFSKINFQEFTGR
jgi:hypothetical protein